jgi:hypothetical protein
VLGDRGPAWKVGLAGTAAAHVVLLLILWSLPEHIFEADRVSSAPAEERTFEIELSPELLVPARPVVEPQRFVEVNPAAPENAPDETPFFGAQNQQVAQPEPTPDGQSDTPAVDGEGRENTAAIVSGTAREPEPPSLADQLAQAFQTRSDAEAEAAEREAEQEAARAVNAPPGGEQLLGTADGGVGTTVTRLPPTPGAETGPEAREGTATGRSRTGGYFGGPVIDRARPQERPRLAEATVNARNTPTIRNEFGTRNIGALAYNAKWSSYGEYLQRLIDAVQAQWDRILMRSSFYPTAGATVRVVFRLDAQGRVSEIVDVSGTGGELAQRLCVSAITERAPYGDWTEEMIAVLGREQELTFTFHYR